MFSRIEDIRLFIIFGNISNILSSGKATNHLVVVYSIKISDIAHYIVTYLISILFITKYRVYD